MAPVTEPAPPSELEDSPASKLPRLGLLRLRWLLDVFGSAGAIRLHRDFPKWRDLERFSGARPPRRIPRPWDF